MKYSLSFLASLVGLLSPAVVFAAEPSEVKVETPQDLIQIVTNVGNVFAAIVFAVAIIMIITAAWKYMTAGGETEKITSAHHTLIYSLVGIAVALFAFVAKTLVVNFLK